MRVPSSCIFVCSLGVLGYALQDQVPLLDQNYERSSPKPLLDQEFSEWLEIKGEQWGMKGLGVSVVQRDAVTGKWTLEAEGYGVMDADGRPVTNETLFAIGSNSKHFAALAIGTLVENSTNELQWTSKLADILHPEWELAEPLASQQVNIQDILSHRTGLPRHDLTFRLGQKPVDVVRNLRNLPLAAGLREKWLYNNLMYIIANLVVERVSGTPFIDYVQENIFSRLGMLRTTYNETGAEESGYLSKGFMLTSLIPKPDGKWFAFVSRATQFWLPESGREILSAEGGVLSDAKDLAIWLQTLLLEGKSPASGEQVIPRGAILQTAQGVAVMAGRAGAPELSPMVYGAGQWIYAYQGHEIVEHEGYAPGWPSVITRLPNDGLGIAIMANWEVGSSFKTIVKWYLIEKALGLPHIDWDTRLRAAYKGFKEDSTTPRDPSHPPAPSLEALVGTYTHPGYPTFNFRIHNSSATLSHSPDHPSPAPASIDIDFTPSLVTHFPTAFFGDDGYMVLSHYSHNVFNATMYYPTSDAKNASDVFDLRVNMGPVTAEFVAGEGAGVGFFGGFWGEEVERPAGAPANIVKGRAEVWFDRS